jgi:hypothetical protein
MCLHTILLDPTNPDRIVIAISAAGAFRTDDAGQTWKPINRGLYSKYIPNPTAEVGHCVHHIAMHPARPAPSSCRSTGTSCAPTTPATTGKISGNLPTDFGFVIDVHAHEPETVYVVPIKSDSEHFPLDGKLRVFRSRSGGNDWEPLTAASPRKTATSTSCATPWPSTPSTTAASTSAPPAARSTLPRLRRQLDRHRPRPPRRPLRRSPDARYRGRPQRLHPRRCHAERLAQRRHPERGVRAVALWLCADLQGSRQ